MKCKHVLFGFLFFLSGPVLSGTAEINGKILKKVRVVGDYTGSVYDNTVELWFTTSITWPAGISCTNTSRVYIDAKHNHLVSAAYMALVSGKTINFLADDQLPNRDGSCEVSFLDVIN